MIIHLVPYEQVFLSITISLDEATALSDALVSSPNDVALELKNLLEDNIDRAAKLQDRRTK